MDYVRPLTDLKSMLDVCLTLEPSFSILEDLSFLHSAGAVHLLGTTYPSGAVDDIKDFSKSIIWFTYRKNWPAPIGGFGGPTSDRGWGCMIRCGQMLLAQAISTIHLGPSWRWKSDASFRKSDGFENYKRLLKMFQDKRTAQFSIHQIAQMGVSEGKQLGEWLGPNTMAQVLKKLVIYDDWSRMVVHVAMDNVLISQDVHIMAALPNKGEQKNEPLDEGALAWTRPLLLIIPLRLGLTGINPCYLNAIIEYFKLPQCLGILGGRPNHAVYFYGLAGRRLLYLDPHVCQEFTDLGTPLPSRDDDSVTSLINASVPTNFSDPEMPSSGVEVELDCQPSTVSSHALTFSSHSSSVSSLNQQNQAISFPTSSSSVSKLSSRSDQSRCCSSTSDEPEMPINRMDLSFIDPIVASTKKEQRWFDALTGREQLAPMEGDEGEGINGQQTGEVQDVVCGTNGVSAREKESYLDARGCYAAAQEEKSGTNEADCGNFDDTTFHCPYLLSMDFKSLEYNAITYPSLALCFLIRSAQEYDDLVQRLKQSLLPSSSPPLFEILDSRPKGWPKFTPFDTSYLQDETLNMKEYDDLNYDSDEQFELLE